jgi:hypothetical protein
MEVQDYMHYGFAKVLFAVCLEDGTIDFSETSCIRKSIDRIQQEKDIDLSMILIVFNQLEKYNTQSPTHLLKNGMHDFHLGDDYLTHELASIYRSILVDVMSAEAPMTPGELEIGKEFMLYLNERIKPGK